MTRQELIKFLVHQANLMRHLHGHEAAKPWTDAEEAAKKFLVEPERETMEETAKFIRQRIEGYQPNAFESTPNNPPKKL